MQITALDIRACRNSDDGMGYDALRGGAGDGLEFLVYTMKTDTGLEASMFGFAGRSSLGTGHLAAASLRPFFVGRDAFDREGAWKDWRKVDRWWHHLPIYSYGPADICLWLLAAKAANLPLYQLLGGAQKDIPAYASSLVLPSAKDYANEALAVKNAGFKAYKTHPPGRDLAEDIEIHEAVRKAVGPDFPLMCDPVAPYTRAEALTLGRSLERLGYLWFEEPLPDEAFGALRSLREDLDIPIIGTEVLAKHPYSVAEAIMANTVDGVRADPSWSGGVTGTLKTAYLAEAHHMNCELHSTIFEPLELVNLHIGSAISNSHYFEVLWPRDNFAFGLKERLPIENGIARAPTGVGLGIELDWDLIDDLTVAEI